MGTWCSGTTPAQHAGGPGLSPSVSKLFAGHPQASHDIITAFLHAQLDPSHDPIFALASKAVLRARTLFGDLSGKSTDSGQRPHIWQDRFAQALVEMESIRCWSDANVCVSTRRFKSLSLRMLATRRCPASLNTFRESRQDPEPYCCL